MRSANGTSGLLCANRPFRGSVVTFEVTRGRLCSLCLLIYSNSFMDCVLVFMDVHIDFCVICRGQVGRFVWR